MPVFKTLTNEPLVIADEDQKHYWWATTQASGSFEWGSIDLNLTFWDVDYYLHRPEGAHHPNM